MVVKERERERERERWCVLCVNQKSTDGVHWAVSFFQLGAVSVEGRAGPSPRDDNLACGFTVSGTMT